MKRINAHYRWLKNPPQAEPRRGELGQPERTVIPADHLAGAPSTVRFVRTFATATGDAVAGATTDARGWRVGEGKRGSKTLTQKSTQPH